MCFGTHNFLISFLLIFQAVEEAGYIKLSVGNEDEIPGTIKRVLNIYDKEVYQLLDPIFHRGEG